MVDNGADLRLAGRTVFDDQGIEIPVVLGEDVVTWRAEQDKPLAARDLRNPAYVARPAPNLCLGNRAGPGDRMTPLGTKSVDMFKSKPLLITGGTATFGNAVLRRFRSTVIREIRIFSCDEKKQDDMRKLHANPKIKFYLGDVRDPGSLREAMAGVDFIFHAAALKQVPCCEFFPIKALRTNSVGAENMLVQAITAGAKRVVVLSTDKAVYPIHATGISRAMKKLFETLHTREEMAVAEDVGDSHNTTRLDVDGMTELLLKLDIVKRAMRREAIEV